MVNEQLKEYVEKARKAGYSDDKIRSELKNAGWDDNEINSALNENLSASSPNAPSSAPPQLSQKDKPLNVLAVIALILSFLFPLIGLILGIIAKNNIKKSGERGKGLAVAAIIISTIFIIISVIAILSFLYTLKVISDRISSDIHGLEEQSNLIECGSHVQIVPIKIDSDFRICFSRENNKGEMAIILQNKGLRDISDLRLRVLSNKLFTKNIKTDKLKKGEISALKLKIDEIEGDIVKISLSPLISVGQNNDLRECSAANLVWEREEITEFKDCNDVGWDDNIELI